ncbi:uncharacterized protein LOC143876026 isoform X2 [Tasmannia lanceolata]|uniref:uncharacterized protein LOC143876026 isoform X2 n=1 Tax=Tasmannia lanceolata TaxID=3420 RepID=UPI004064372A
MMGFGSFGEEEHFTMSPLAQTFTKPKPSFSPRHAIEEHCDFPLRTHENSLHMNPNYENTSMSDAFSTHNYENSIPSCYGYNGSQSVWSDNTHWNSRTHTNLVFPYCSQFSEGLPYYPQFHSEFHVDNASVIGPLEGSSQTDYAGNLSDFGYSYYWSGLPLDREKEDDVGFSWKDTKCKEVPSNFRNPIQKGSLAGESSIGSKCIGSGWEDTKCPYISEENVIIPYDMSGTSVFGPSPVLPYSPIPDTESLRKIWDPINLNTSHDRFFTNLDSSPSYSSVVQGLGPMSKNANCGDQPVDSSNVSGDCANPGRVDGTGMKRKDHSFVDSTPTKKDLSLNHKSVSGDHSGQSPMEKSKLKIPTLSILNAFLQSSSQTFDEYNPAVDSPCWKGASASQNPSFGFEQVVENNGVSVSTEFAEHNGASDISSDHSLPNNNACLLVKTIHHLSELLLCSNYSKVNSLKEQDYDVLRLVIGNLYACVAKEVGLMRAMPGSFPELGSSYSFRKPTDLHKGSASGRSLVLGIEADDDLSQHIEEKLCSSMSSKKENRSHDFVSASADMDLQKDNGITQAVKKVMKENMSDEGENHPRTLLYKNLWIESEAALSSMKYELELAKMKIEMEKIEQDPAQDSRASSNAAGKSIYVEKFNLKETKQDQPQDSSSNAAGKSIYVEKFDLKETKQDQAQAGNSIDVEKFDLKETKQDQTQDSHASSNAAGNSLYVEKFDLKKFDGINMGGILVTNSKERSTENFPTPAPSADVTQCCCMKLEDMNQSSIYDQIADDMDSIMASLQVKMNRTKHDQTQDSHALSDAAGKSTHMEKFNLKEFGGVNMGDNSAPNDEERSTENFSTTQGDDVTQRVSEKLEDVNQSSMKDQTKDIEASVIPDFFVLESRVDDSSSTYNVGQELQPKKVSVLGSGEGLGHVPKDGNLRDQNSCNLRDNGVNSTDEIGLGSNGSEQLEMTRELHVGIAGELGTQSQIPENILSGGESDSSSSEWEHVEEEDL